MNWLCNHTHNTSILTHARVRARAHTHTHIHTHTLTLIYSVTLTSVSQAVKVNSFRGNESCYKSANPAAQLRIAARCRPQRFQTINPHLNSPPPSAPLPLLRLKTLGREEGHLTHLCSGGMGRYSHAGCGIERISKGFPVCSSRLVEVR